jgi:hypothetical protein
MRKERGRELPLDYLVPHFLQPILNLCDIDILAPGLLAFTGGLFVLRGRFLCGGHVDCSVRGSRMSKKPSGVEFANKSSKFQIRKVRNFADSSDETPGRHTLHHVAGPACREQLAPGACLLAPRPGCLDKATELNLLSHCTNNHTASSPHDSIPLFFYSSCTARPRNL